MTALKSYSLETTPEKHSFSPTSTNYIDTTLSEDNTDEFDDNDRKIIQLYEVINELMDEQKARAQDLELLYRDTDHMEVLSFVEARNETVLKQLFEELDLTEKKDDSDNEDESSSDDEEEEDEQDEGWEIYNSVVQNLNDYMQKLADFSAKLKIQQELIETYEGPQAEDIEELENVITAQTQALEQQMRRNGELESALSNVLTEYSNRINVSNTEISSLHAQLSKQNNSHAQQLQQLRQMYDNKIKELSKTAPNVYKQELDELLQQFSVSRDNFHSATNQMAKDMRESQERHHKEIIKLTYDVTNVTAQLADKQLAIRELEQQFLTVTQPQLERVVTTLDIDDEDDYMETSVGSYKSNIGGNNNITNSSNRYGNNPSSNTSTPSTANSSTKIRAFAGNKKPKAKAYSSTAHQGSHAFSSGARGGSKQRNFYSKQSSSNTNPNNSGFKSGYSHSPSPGGGGRGGSGGSKAQQIYAQQSKKKQRSHRNR